MGYQINIIDTERYAVADAFLAYDPPMSPDQRWIASRHFYAPQSEIPISEEYLLYDMNATASQNRRNPSPYTSDAAGWSIYPAFPGDAPVDPLDVPDLNRHGWRSKSFSWGADSQSIVLADRVGKSLSLVLVLIRDTKPQAYTHVVSSAEVCNGSERGEPDSILKSATVSAVSPGRPSVLASFEDSSGDSGCQPRQLKLLLDDFQPARVERYVRHSREADP